MQVDTFISAIVAGQWKRGERIPSENELAERYGVTRMQVRKVLEQLGEMGYTYAVQGKGRFLRPHVKKIDLPLTGSESFTEKIEQQQLTLETQLLTLERLPRDARWQRFAGDVIKVERLRIVEGEPIAIHCSYVCAEQFPHLLTDYPRYHSMFAFYAAEGKEDFLSTDSVLTITFPTTAEKDKLGCGALQPLHYIESDCLDARTGELLEMTTIHYRSDRFAFQLS